MKAILSKFENKPLQVSAITVLALLFLCPVPNAFAFDDAAAQKTFKRCVACHAIGPEAKNKIGPHLNGLEGRVFGTVEGYKYSKALKSAGEEGRAWDPDSLDALLKKPKDFLKGTKMSFSGLRKDEERRNLVDWLLHFDAQGNELSDKVKFNGTDENLLGKPAWEIAGDQEYGQYLSGECVTCHKVSGGDDGIPSIAGWPKENFIDALYRYKNDLRENPVMQTLTKRLGDEEMAALAAYFGSLKQE